MAEYPFTEEGLRDALKALGRRRQKVRRTLRKHRCLGDPDSCNSCPVAMYLMQIFGTDDVVVEDRATLTLDRFVDEGNGRYYEATDRISVAVPPPVFDFMNSFDALQYPDLILVHPKEPPV